MASVKTNGVFKTIFISYLFIYCCVCKHCAHAISYMGTTEVNSQESASSASHVCSETERRPSGSYSGHPGVPDERPFCLHCLRSRRSYSVMPWAWTCSVEPVYGQWHLGRCSFSQRPRKSLRALLFCSICEKPRLRGIELFGLGGSGI